VTVSRQRQNRKANHNTNSARAYYPVDDQSFLQNRKCGENLR
jgi:hypothetical protein